MNPIFTELMPCAVFVSPMADQRYPRAGPRAATCRGEIYDRKSLLDFEIIQRWANRPGSQSFILLSKQV